MSEEPVYIGKATLRKDVRDKVTGAAQYVADLNEQAAVGLLLRSPHHHARILRIDIAAAKAMPDVLAVVTAEDIPGGKTFGMLAQDQPPLALGKVRHQGEPVVLVVARSRAAAEAARAAVVVDYEPLPAVFDPRDALAEGAPLVHDSGNLLACFDVGDGDVEKGFAEADVIMEETFSVGRISPAYMEAENSLAAWQGDGTLVVYTSSQHPFTDRVEIAHVLGMPVEKVQVKSAVVGGAFGGKEDASLAIVTALGAWACKGSVRLVNNRHESFLAHPKRHPAQITLKIGAKKDGSLVALQGTAYVDTGAYASLGPAVGSLLTEMVPGPYRIPNVRVQTSVAYTHSPLSGAVRGFGSPQAHFAIESMIDILAHRLGMPPVELRRKNILKPGDRVFTRVEMNNSAHSLALCLEKVAEVQARLQALPASPGKKCGVGFALGAQTMGLGAKVPDDSSHRLEWQPDGKVTIYLGTPDLGQGLEVVSEQMTAETLGIAYDNVKTITVDTQVVPNGGTICASRMTYMVGNALLEAAEQLKRQLLEQASRMLNVTVSQLKYEKGHVIAPDGRMIPAAEFLSRSAEEGLRFSAETTFSFPYPEQTTPQHLPIGMPHVLFCFGAQVARVEVDPDLGTVDVTDLVAIHDVGRVINRTGVEGQIDGGMALGLGYALYEQMPLKQNGQWVDSFTEYLLPTARDIPTRYERVILEVPEASGPFGAKGIGEVTVVPTAPAVANAVYQATGVRVKQIPIQPEMLVKALEMGD